MTQPDCAIRPTETPDLDTDDIPTQTTPQQEEQPSRLAPTKPEKEPLALRRLRSHNKDGLRE